MTETHTCWWEVKIQGDRHDLEYLASHHSAPERTVIVHYDAPYDEYVLRSPRFVGLADDGQVHAAAVTHLAMLSGVLRLARQSNTSLWAGAVSRRGEGGQREIFCHVVEAANLRDEWSANITSVDDVGIVITHAQQPPRSIAIVELALTSPTLSKALRLFGEDDAGWADHYRLFEVIADDVGGEHNLVKAGWTSKAQYRRFMHTANSPGAIGDEARHGVESGQPPSSPMTLDEASAYVAYLLHAWIAAKGV